jgi:EAL and modified HD-GYP domain-containing signal transduction protein
MEGIFIGRQPILDRAGNLHAYELLHRSGRENHAAGDDGDRMSSDMLLNAALQVGIRKLNGACPVFINVTRNVLLNGGLDSLPSERMGLEVLETVSVDEQIIERLRDLRARGFIIALDDFVYSPERAPLIDCADIVKLDVLALSDASLKHHVALLKERRVKLLAEKVETTAMHSRVLALGFDLFQGYFFARPEVFKSQAIRPNNLVLIQLLARIHDPDITPEELSNIIRGDVSMSVTVLRWANSPFYGLLHAVESVERAVVVLGLYTIKNWVSLLALARIGGTATELHTTILVRARTCELLAAAAAMPNASSYFTVGLLSALDVLLRVNMDQALEYIPLGPDQKAALLDRSGRLGQALSCVTALESGDENAAKFAALSIAEISRCYFSAVDWVNQLGSKSTAKTGASFGKPSIARKRGLRAILRR